MAEGNGGDIIIKGGSVELEYDDSVYPKDLGEPKKHNARDREITRVLVVDGSGAKKFDSNDTGENPAEWGITTYTKKK